MSPNKIATLEPIAIKFRTIDYDHDMQDPLNQIWYISINWGLLGKWVKYNVTVPFIYVLMEKKLKTVCKDDSHYLAELKQQKSKRLIVLLQHIAITSMYS